MPARSPPRLHITPFVAAPFFASLRDVDDNPKASNGNLRAEPRVDRKNSPLPNLPPSAIRKVVNFSDVVRPARAPSVLALARSGLTPTQRGQRIGRILNLTGTHQQR